MSSLVNSDDDSNYSCESEENWKQQETTNLLTVGNFQIYLTEADKAKLI